jgi:protein phosphatase
VTRAHFSTVGASHPGRRRTNADAWSASTRRAVIADGAGEYGLWAAQEAVAAAMHTPPGNVRAAIRSADAAVRAVDAHAGSTIVVVELTDASARAAATTINLGADAGVDHGPSEITVGHVGDSRCLLVAEGKGSAWLTEMHNGAAELVRSGVIGPAEAADHPFQHRLTRSLGGSTATPDLRRVTVRSGDRLVLLTDGVHAALDLAEIDELARRTGDPALALVDAAFAAGATDNITAVVLDVFTGWNGPQHPGRGRAR